MGTHLRLSQTVHRADELAIRTAEWVQAHPILCWLTFSAFYFGTGVVAATRRPLWFDEIATIYIACLPDFGSVWEALKQGADANPPLFYVINRMVLVVLGESPLAIRLPALTGFWLMSLCIYLFVRRRCEAVYAWVAALFPLATGAGLYAIEGRPYGLVLGFSAVALLCWQEADRHPRNWTPPAGVALAVAASVSCHFYAVFLVAALGIGEIYRTIDRGRPDWRMWTALLFGLAPLAGFHEIASAATVYAGNDWSRPTLRRTIHSYDTLLEPLLMPAVALLLVTSWMWILRRSSGNRDGAGDCRFWPADAAAALGFSVWPLLAGTIAILVTGVYTPRYSLPSVIGLAVLVAFVLRAAERGRLVVATVFAAILIAYSGSVGLARVRAADPAMDLGWVHAVASPAEPAVIDSAHLFMQVSYNAGDDPSRQLWYVADPVQSHRHTGHSSADTALLKLRSWTRLPVVKRQEFLPTYPVFYVVKDTVYDGWILTKMVADGAAVTLVRRRGDILLFRVEQRR